MPYKHKRNGVFTGKWVGARGQKGNKTYHTKLFDRMRDAVEWENEGIAKLVTKGKVIADSKSITVRDALLYHLHTRMALVKQGRRRKSTITNYRTLLKTSFSIVVSEETNVSVLISDNGKISLSVTNEGKWPMHGACATANSPA